MSPNWTQSDILQHAQKSNSVVKNKNKSSNDPKRRAQELKSHYQTHFVKGSEKKTTTVFYNYCCNIGHTSIECELRKGSNNSKVIWVPKSKE
jgi:hypothetical protein